MSMSKKYWKGLPELHNSPEFQAQQKNEFANLFQWMSSWAVTMLKLPELRAAIS